MKSNEEIYSEVAGEDLESVTDEELDEVLEKSEEVTGKKVEISDKLKSLLVAKPSPILVPWDMGLNSGSTMLNLACSGRPDVAFVPGCVYYYVGDSSSGKSWCCLAALAEATLNEKYNDYQLIFDNVENGALMDIRRFFGKRLADRLRPPKGTVEEPVYSTTTESLYFNLAHVMDSGPCIYVIDSMDALTSEDEEDKFKEMKEAFEKGKSTTGTFGTSKAKLNSVLLRKAHNRVQETKSILFLISQTRDNIGFGAQFNPKTRSGGRSLTFYSQLEIWSSIKGHVKVSYNKKDRELGVLSLFHIKKNRLSGKDRKVIVPILHSSGIDDVGSMVDYLVEEKRWTETRGRINADDDMGFSGYREKLIEHIQDNDKIDDLKKLVYEVWTEIEEAIEVKRVSRYE